MTLKKNIFLLIVFSIIFILKGFEFHASLYYEHLLLTIFHSSQGIESFNMFFSLGLSIGALIGGFSVDKWNLRRLAIIDILLLSLSSLILQFYTSIIYILIHRFILGYSFGFLIISFKVLFTDLSNAQHRGKLLFILLNSTMVGSTIYLAMRAILISTTGDFDISYKSFQLPFIILPILLFFSIKYLPDNSKKENKSSNIKDIFKRKQRSLVYIMVLLALLSVFSKSITYFRVSSMIIFDQQNELLYFLSNIIGIIGAILGIIFIDKLGRKKLLKFGIILLIISSTFNLITSLIIKNTFAILGFISFYQLISTFTIFTTCYIIILEYLPPEMRGRGFIVFMIFVWLANGVNNVIHKTVIIDSEFNIVISSALIIVTLLTIYLLLRNRLIETNGLLFSEIKNKISIE